MKYKFVKRANPQDREQEKIYAAPSYEGRITKSELVKEIVGLLFLAILLAPVGTFAQNFVPDVNAIYRIASADATTGYMYYSGGSYVEYKTDMDNSQKVQFVATAVSGEYNIRFLERSAFMRCRGNSQAVNTGTNDSEATFTFVFSENRLGVDYYNLKSKTDKYLAFSTSDSYIRAYTTLGTGDNFKLAFIVADDGFVTTALETAIQQATALKDTIAILAVKTKLETELTVANTVLTTAQTQTELDNKAAYINALRTFAENIQSSKKLYDTTTEGTAGGEYPAAARTAFNTAITDAINAFSAVTDVASANAGNTTLNTAKAAYNAAIVVPVFTPLANKSYIIRHATNFVLTQADDGKARIATLTNADTQKFRFIPVAGSTDKYHIASLSDGKLLSKLNSWETQWLENNATNMANTNAQFTFVFKSGEFYNIRCVSSSSCFGTDDITDNAEIYSNKSGSDAARHYWKFEEQEGDLGLVVSVLENTLSTANDLYDNSVAGTDPGQYTGKDAFLAAIQAAQAIFDAATAQTPTATQQQIDDVATALANAITAFQSTQIIVDFAPEAGKYYRIYSADQERWPNQYLYSAGTVAESGQKHGVITNETDSAFLYQFVQDSTYWRIMPASEVNKAEEEKLWIYERGSGGSGMAARLKTTIDNTTRFAATWEKRQNNVDYFSFKSERGYWLLFGANSNDLKSTATFGVDPNGNISAPGSFQFAILEASAKSSLENTLNNAQNALSTAIVGTETGQYPQEAVDSLTDAIAQAQAVYDNTNAADAELSVANDSLKNVLDWFISQQITFSTQFIGKDCNIIHYSGNLLSKTDEGLAHIYSLNKPNTLQVFRFEPVPGQVDIVSLKSSDNKYLSFSSWNTLWIDSINTTTYLKLSYTADSFLNIKFVDKGALGTDTATDSAAVYTDKSGNDINHKWLPQEPGQVIKVQLYAALVTANLLLDTTSVGTTNFDFPQTAIDVLTAAVVAATTVYNNVNVTQAVVDQQIAILNSAIDAYYAQQILPVFSPNASIQYLITNKQYTGFVKENGNQAIVETTPPVTGWEFVAVRDSVWIIRSGSKALAKSLNMINYDASSTDLHWYVHYDGPKANNVYVKDETDTLLYFSFTSNGNYENALAMSSSSALQIVSSHSHSSQSQWFAFTPVGAPIVDALESLIAEVENVIATTAVGTEYGQYPQDARDALNEALLEAQNDLANSATMNQQQINDATQDLQSALNTYYNQKVVWKPESNMAYFIGNRDNANYLSVDTLDISVAKGYKQDSILFVNQLWFFVPVENQAGFYYLVNGNKSVGTSGGTNVFIQDYDPLTASKIEVSYLNTTSGTDYFALTTTNTYPNIHIDANGTIGTDRFTYNNYQIKLVAAGALRTEILYATQLLDSTTVGNNLGETPQSAYDAFLDVINSAITTATDGDDTNDDAKLIELIAAEETFRTSVNGYGLNLEALNEAIATAEDFIKTTTVVGSGTGECPQSVIDALQNAIITAKDATGGVTQTTIDGKVTTLLAAIETFKTDMKTSTGLAALIQTCQQLHDDAVEGEFAGQYTLGSKAIFLAAINAALTALSAELVNQANLLDALNVLTQAFDVFNAARNPDVDLEGLLAVISEVETFLQNKGENEFTGLRAKLAEAKELCENPTNQEDIDAMTSILETLLLSSGLDDVYNNSIIIFAQNKNLQIKGLLESCRVSVYALNGNIISTEIVENTEYTKKLMQGTYVVSVKGQNIDKKEILIVR